MKNTKIFHRSIGVLLVSLFLLASCATSEGPKFDFSTLIWPQPPETPRVKYVALWLNRESFESDKKSWAAEVFGDETVPEGLGQPIGVAADAAGNIYVADTLGKGIVVFDMGRRTVRYIAGVTAPMSVAVDDAKGLIWASGQNGRVNQYDENGKLRLSLGQNGEFKVPAGVAVDRKTGRLFVVDSKLNKIFVYDRDGKPVGSFGSPGREDGQFWYPVRAAIDAQGRIYVCDSGNFRVQIFDSNFKFLKKFGHVGTGLADFVRPKDIAVDSEGHIWVTDGGANTVKIFDSDGNILMLLGETGHMPGQFWLPSGLYIDSQDRVYVTETLNKRVQVFQYLSDKYKASHPEEMAEIGKKRGAN